MHDFDTGPAITDVLVLHWSAPAYEPFSRLPLASPVIGLFVVLGVTVSTKVARWLGARCMVAWILIVSLGVILAATLTPLITGFGAEARGSRTCDFSRFGLADLADLTGPTDVLGNILMFIPLGIAVALIPRSSRKTVLLVIAFSLPFVIEATQFLVTPLGRACQGADITDNLTGLTLGILVGTLMGRRKQRANRPPFPHTSEK